MSPGAALLASLLVTLGRQAWWVLALAGFLVRGGFVLFLLPILILPSPLAISNEIAPFVESVAFGRIGPEVTAPFLATCLAIVTWLVVGGLVGAATDVTLIREAAAAAAEEGVAGGGSRGGAQRVGRSNQASPVVRVLAARLLLAGPLVLALGLGAIRIIAVTYGELIRPVDVSTPLVVRVAVGAAVPLVLIVVAWAFAELAAGLAARHIALDGVSVGRAIVTAARDLVRHPLATVAPWAVSTLVLFGGLAIVLGAARIAWMQVLLVLATPTTEPAVIVLTILAFVGIWVAALLVAGVLASVRSVATTFGPALRMSATDAPDARTADDGVSTDGTFGASTHHLPGDWSTPDEGGSL
jgi:hypothetical protein